MKRVTVDSSESIFVDDVCSEWSLSNAQVAFHGVSDFSIWVLRGDGIGFAFYLVDSRFLGREVVSPKFKGTSPDRCIRDAIYAGEDVCFFEEPSEMLRWFADHSEEGEHD